MIKGNFRLPFEVGNRKLLPTSGMFFESVGFPKRITFRRPSPRTPKGASLTHPGGIPTVNLVHKDIVIYNGN